VRLPARGAVPAAGRATRSAIVRLFRNTGAAVVGALAIIAGAAPALAQPAPAVSAVRVWPAPDSTRVTFESARPIGFNVFTVRDPDRVVLELETNDPGAALAKLAGAIPADDPLIRQARVARYKPGVVRVVFDLKAEAAPQAFALKPAGEFGHRIVLDLFAANARDPVAAFLERQRISATAQAAAGAGSGNAPAAAPTSAAPPQTPIPQTPAPQTPAPQTPAPQTPTSQTPVPQATASERAAPGGDTPGRPASTGARRTLVIAIDPGHGGEDPGAIGPTGVREKDVVLAISRRLARLIDAQDGLRAHLIRDGDYFVPLHMRVARARALKADLFVSVHADAWLYATARGSSVYALSLSGATSAAARWLARRENEADLIGGVNLNVADPILKQTLLDLSQTAAINDSLRLGRHVLKEMGRINRLHRKQVEQAGFAVLKAPDIPSILVETAFISNPEEEQRLTSEAEQERLARAIFEGLRRYIADTPSLARPR
jgi:N-acetylmuramoyl-L-alanine amidase